MTLATNYACFVGFSLGFVVSTGVLASDFVLTREYVRSLERDLSHEIDPGFDSTAAQGRGCCVSGGRNYNAKNLDVKYKVEGLGVVDQGQSDECWIYAFEQLLSLLARKERGVDLHLSPHYISYWDIAERAVGFFETIMNFVLAGKTWQDTDVDTYIHDFSLRYGDYWDMGNIVEKWGVVRREDMPAKRKDSNQIEKLTLICHEFGAAMLDADSPSLEVLDSIKTHGMKMIMQRLKSAYGGEAPESIEINGELFNKLAGRNQSDSVSTASYVRLDPSELFDYLGFDFDDYILVSFYPQIKGDTRYEFLNASNVLGGQSFRGLNTEFNWEIREAVRKSIQDGVPVYSLVEMEDFDRSRGVLSPENGGADKISGWSSTKARWTKIRFGTYRALHIMLISGCDDEEGKPISDSRGNTVGHRAPMWRFHNSWGRKHQHIFADQEFLANHLDWMVIDKAYLPQRLIDLNANGELLQFSSYKEFKAGNLDDR